MTSKKKITRKKVIKPDVAALVLGVSERVDDLHTKFNEKVTNIAIKIDALKDSVDEKFDGHNHSHINYENKIKRYLFIICAFVVGGVIFNRFDWIFAQVQLLIKLIIGY